MKRSEKARTCLDKRAVTINGTTYVSYLDALAAVALTEGEADEEMAKLTSGMGILDLREMEGRMEMYLSHVPTLWDEHADAYRAGVGVCLLILRQAIIDKFTREERSTSESLNE